MKNIRRHFTPHITSRPWLALCGALLLGSVPACWAQSNVSVFATGLNNPRGLKFGPDGNLYVAEGGDGGLNPCDIAPQVVPPIGPYTGSVTGSRISKIDAATGRRTTLIDNLPSSQTSPTMGVDIMGVGDVAFVGDTMYALITGAGASHGVPTIPNGVVRINADGTYTMVANLSQYYATHPVQNPSSYDFEPDGVPYSMISHGGALYVMEPNRGSFDRVALDGTITRILDTSIEFGHLFVPTVSAFYKGSFYLGNLGSFHAGAADVLKVDPQGQDSILYSGFTDILGIAIDKSGTIYVLEANTGTMGPAPMTGDLIRIRKNGKQKVIASGLNFPTGVTIGPDGALYVSNVGFGPLPNGLGQVLKITDQ